MSSAVATLELIQSRSLRQALIVGNSLMTENNFVNQMKRGLVCKLTCVPCVCAVVAMQAKEASLG